MSERTCVTCEWWEAKSFHEKERNSGLCRCYPPVKIDGDEGGWSWPETFDEDWCGKFTPKEELPRQKMHDPVSAYEEQNWRSRGDSEEDIAARIAARGRA